MDKTGMDLISPEMELDLLREDHERMQKLIIRLREIHPPKFKHECLEWDGLEIDEYDPEFSYCCCYGEKNGNPS